MEIKISQFCSMITLIMFNCFLGILVSSSLNIAAVDAWLIPIIAIIPGTLIILIFLYIYNYKPNLNLNELITHLFGDKLGKIINIIVLLFIFSFNVITFWNLINFVASQYLYNTPEWFINLIFIFVTFYFFSKKDRTIFRASLIFFYLFIFLFIISSIGLIGKVDINNIKPLLENGTTPVFKGVFNYIGYTTLPLFMLSIFKRNQINNKKINKQIIITYLFSNFLIFIILFLLISVFGIELASIYEYPSYHVLKRVFIGGFIERLENVLSIMWIIVLFIPCAFSYLYSLKSMKNIFNTNKNYYFYPVLIFLMFISQFIFKNNTIGENFLVNIYPIIITIIIGSISLIIFIKIIKKNLLK